MKKKLLTICAICALLFSSCKNEAKNDNKNEVKNEEKSEGKYGAPVVATAAVFKNFQSFWAYKHEHIRLYEDFVGIDESGKIINRATFYKTIATGDYFPVRLTSTDSVNYYQLHKLAEGTDKDIVSTVKNWAITEYNDHLLEGTALPTYKFVDLAGKTYTPESTKGKIVVLKCWFLACMPCIAEMPTLNRIKETYKGRDDILFLSLCMENPEPLKNFLKTTKFDYAQIGGQKDYFKNKLHVQSFPTHYVINKQGLIVKKTTHNEEMAYVLKREAGEIF